MTITRAIWLASLLLVACGGNGGGGSNTPGSDGGDNITPAVDSGSGTVDALVPANCDPGATQCSDCIDNDGDQLIDGFDPHCTSPFDKDESSFATEIPGDNMGSSGYQDCFYDGDTGSGNDGCKVPNCCLLDPDGAGCPPKAGDSCVPSRTCIDSCLPAVAPGCDCFGCCTICHGGSCHTVVTHPNLAPNCTLETLGDPTKCPPCTQNAQCSNPCDPENCILCPGQSPSDLPESCSGQAECPNNATACTTSADCTGSEYCAQGCCVAVFIE